MTQYNSLNAKLSNSKLNKLKSVIKNETEVVLTLSSNMIGDETNFTHKLLLINRQVANLHKAFVSKPSIDIKLSKIILLGGFLGRLFGPLLKTGLPLMKTVIRTLASAAADAGKYKEILGSGKHSSDSASHNNTILIIPSDEMKTSEINN